MYQLAENPLIDLPCGVCEVEPAVAVATVPGVPMAIAYGAECLLAHAHPWWLLTANTAMIGGLDAAPDWWREMVTDTCTHLGRSLDGFNADVAKLIEGERYAEAQKNAHDRRATS